MTIDTEAPVPAAPYGVDDEAANRIALAVYDCKNGINPEPLLYVINRILGEEIHPLSVEGRDALLQSAPQAPAVPELDPMTRLIVSDPKQLKPKKQEPAVPTDEQIHAAYRVALGQSIRERDMPEIRKFAIALLQSAEVTK